MTDDDRVTCLTCAQYRAGRCHDAKRAGVGQWAVSEIARDLAELPQRCPAYRPGRKAEVPPTSDATKEAT